MMGRAAGIATAMGIALVGVTIPVISIIHDFFGSEVFASAWQGVREAARPRAEQTELKRARDFTFFTMEPVKGHGFEVTTRKQEASYHSEASDLNLSSREMARSTMKPDEVLAMEQGTAWMFVRNMRPVLLHLVTYAEVSPWRDWVGVSPITGTRLHAAQRVHVDYPKKGGRDAHR